MAHVAVMTRARCPREGQRETHHCEMLVWDHQSVLKTPLGCCPASPLSPMSPPTVMDALPPRIVSGAFGNVCGASEQFAGSPRGSNKSPSGHSVSSQCPGQQWDKPSARCECRARSKQFTANICTKRWKETGSPSKGSRVGPCFARRLGQGEGERRVMEERGKCCRGFQP